MLYVIDDIQVDDFQSAVTGTPETPKGAFAVGARGLEILAVPRSILDCFTLRAQYAVDNFRRRAPISDLTGAQDWKMGTQPTHGVDVRSKNDSTDFAGTNGIGAHETRFSARIKRASRKV